MSVDYKKMMALHNAGWDSAKIADEMRMTEEEYINAITEKLDEINTEIRKLEHRYENLAALTLM